MDLKCVPFGSLREKFYFLGENLFWGRIEEKMLLVYLTN